MPKILIAEDNVMVGLMIQYDLEGAGFTALGPFPRSAPALAAAREAAAGDEPVALALLDIDLSGGDSGLDIARTLKGDHGTPCLFVTGQSYEASEYRALALGALAKPYTSADLVAAVTTTLAVIGGAPKDEASPVTWF